MLTTPLEDLIDLSNSIDEMIKNNVVTNETHPDDLFRMLKNQQDRIKLAMKFLNTQNS